MTTPSPKRAVPRRRSSRTDPSHAVYEFDLWLESTEPVIWRTIAVSATTTLATLHDIVQVVMGWDDSHLHEFRTRSGQRFEPVSPRGMLLPEFFLESDGGLDEGRVTLRELFKELSAPLTYIYDFGDTWTHSLKLVATHATAEQFEQIPTCLEGELAGPPEDCGGPWGYGELAELLRTKPSARRESEAKTGGAAEAEEDPDEIDDQEARREWAGDFDPDHFDLVGIRERLAELVPAPTPRRRGTKQRPRKSR